MLARRGSFNAASGGSAGSALQPAIRPPTPLPEYRRRPPPPHEAGGGEPPRGGHAPPSSLDILYAKRIRRISQDFIFVTPFSRRQAPPRLAERPRERAVPGRRRGGGGGAFLSLPSMSRRSRCRRPPPTSAPAREKREPRRARARACGRSVEAPAARGAPGTGARLPTKVRFFQSFRSFVYISPP